ncbi:MAG: plasmid pRiA4b ORF-3 family protein [Propionivibrio sp.]|nr:plasmid pRiA4b ORF-3 family protein [Propionivibrio sp.]
MATSVNSVFVFKVALKHQKRIWRKIAIRGDQTLATLHNAIFVAFDRDDHHLYSFYFSSRPTSTSRNRLAGALRYGCPYSETDDRADITRVDSLPLNLKGRFEYLFDYGDEWWHEITLEEIHPPQKDVKYPPRHRVWWRFAGSIPRRRRFPRNAQRFRREGRPKAAPWVAYRRA